MENNAQRTDDWYAARLGKMTASMAYKMMHRLKSKGTPKSKTYWEYVADVAAERLTGEAGDFYENAAMRWGTETEPQARAAYEFITGNQIEDADFADHPTLPNAGASPDGRVYNSEGKFIGLTEFKCPQSNTFVKYVGIQGEDDLEEKYVHQMHWQMACEPQALFCDYCVFDPRIKDLEMQMWIVRIARDDAIIADMEVKAAEFEQDVLEVIEKIRQRTAREAA
ncbi:lambda exonuclease family protein [Thalassobius sp. Cn5-15]|uniref:lambda exonuclease family protein n=1 Tax=Thalassobius sp. Cn5-15 TaxID=2917763 RepID=UPI001EF21DE5|nr:lambda exonuclease family protein [Thalassobius sp. Cn5-15]MCG7492447.1 YqaJ viral recombinase family protein [Thalassobius sp. Cn5-15]